MSSPLSLTRVSYILLDRRQIETHMNPDHESNRGKKQNKRLFSLFFALIIELLFISEVAPSSQGAPPPVGAVFSASHAAVRFAKRLPPVSHKSVHRQRRG